MTSVVEKTVCLFGLRLPFLQLFLSRAVLPRIHGPTMASTTGKTYKTAFSLGAENSFKYCQVILTSQ